MNYWEPEVGEQEPDQPVSKLSVFLVALCWGIIGFLMVTVLRWSVTGLISDYKNFSGWPAVENDYYVKLDLPSPRRDLIASVVAENRKPGDHWFVLIKPKGDPMNQAERLLEVWSGPNHSPKIQWLSDMRLHVTVPCGPFKNAKNFSYLKSKKIRVIVSFSWADFGCKNQEQKNEPSRPL
jgi:hypothetical protein